jgi:hypothetical protein
MRHYSSYLDQLFHGTDRRFGVADHEIGEKESIVEVSREQDVPSGEQEKKATTGATVIVILISVCFLFKYSPGSIAHRRVCVVLRLYRRLAGDKTYSTMGSSIRAYRKTRKYSR